MRAGRWWRRAAAFALAAAGGINAAVAAPACGAWPAWEQFRNRFLSADGRVIDPRLPEKLTVSEGQAYAMLFALIGNDRQSFDRLLRWTQDNLARGDLKAHLPAWKWGQKPDGSWGVLDSNPASDADVWMAYALIEAASLWQQPAYDALGVQMASHIARLEVRELAGLGPTLIPGPQGFVMKDHVRLNHSYFAPQPLRRLAQRLPAGPWNAVLQSARSILTDGAPSGIAPDWVLWRPASGFAIDDATRRLGSYDAIRVYLWIGLLDVGDPDRQHLLAHYAPIRKTLRADGIPVEKIDTLSGQTQGHAPGGFSAALLPYFAASGDVAAVNAQLLRLTERRVHDSGVYYDQALRLFGEGGWSGRYRFASDGSLAPRWVSECRPGPLK